jgi:hypothetical protein
VFYLVHDTGDDDPTEARRFPYATKEEAEEQMKHELKRNKSAKKSHYKIEEAEE